MGAYTQVHCMLFSSSYTAQNFMNIVVECVAKRGVCSVLDVYVASLL